MATLYQNSSLLESSLSVIDGLSVNLTNQNETDETTIDDCFVSSSLESVPWPSVQLFLIVLYSTSSLLALVGNVVVMVVAVVGSQSAHSIRAQLINLAVSDIILGVLCVPFTYTDFMLGQWIFPHWLCPTAQYVQLVSVFVTSITLTIIGVERYMATLHPFSWLRGWLSSHSYVLLCLSWLLGGLYGSIPLSHTYTRAFVLNNETYYECSYDNGLSPLKRRAFMTSNLVLTFLLPLIVLIGSYSAIMRKLLSDRANKQSISGHFPVKTINNTSSTGSNTFRPSIKSPRKLLLKIKNSTDSTMPVSFDNDFTVGNESPNSTWHQSTRSRTSGVSLRKSRHNNRSKTIKMMFTVMLLYGVCWAPIKLYQFLLDYGFISYCTESQLYALIATYFTCHWIAMANSFVNPIVYSFMSKSFRNDFRKITKIFNRKFSRSKENTFSRHYSVKSVSTHV